MPEVTLTYEDPETLKVIIALSELLDFEILSIDRSKGKLDEILIPGDKTIDPSDLFKVFTGKDIDAARLRKEAWQGKIPLRYNP